MRTIQTEVPEQLFKKAEALVKEGWFRDEKDIFSEAQYPFIPNKKAHVLYNAVDYSEQVPKQTKEKMQLLFCSRWVGYKGFFVLLDALKLLEKNIGVRKRVYLY